MKIRTAIGAGAFIAAGLGIFGLADMASAHHPTYHEDCAGISVSGTDYPAGSHVHFAVDGKDILNKTFDGEGFSSSLSWDQTVSHTFLLVVTSPDHIGEVNWSGTQVACKPPTTTTSTTVQPTTTTTVPPTTTTAPPVVTTPVPPTTIPPVDTTVAQPDTTPPATVKETPSITPTTACTPAGQPIGPGAVLCDSLPPTGSETDVVLGAAAILLPLGGILFLLRRRPEAA